MKKDNAVRQHIIVMNSKNMRFGCPVRLHTH